MHLSPNVNNIVLSVLPTIVLFQMLMVHLRNTQAFELDEPRTNLGLSLLTSQKPYLTKYNFRKLRTSTARIVFRTVYQRQCYWWQCRISEWHCCRWLEWRPNRCSKTVSLFISIRKIDKSFQNFDQCKTQYYYPQTLISISIFQIFSQRYNIQ